MALPKNARHSPDFAAVLWNGIEHTFTRMQAAIVQMLWDALANDTPDVHASTLLVHAGSRLKKDRIDPLFFRHPAWKTMIVRGSRRGTYRLDVRAKKKRRPPRQKKRFFRRICG